MRVEPEGDSKGYGVVSFYGDEVLIKADQIEQKMVLLFRYSSYSIRLRIGHSIKGYSIFCTSLAVSVSTEDTYSLTVRVSVGRGSKGVVGNFLRNLIAVLL